MNNRQLRQALKQVYTLKESEKEKMFLRRYEKRERPFILVLADQFGYLGLKSILWGAFLFAVMIFIAKTKNLCFMWGFSSFLPLALLVPISALGRSERYKMEELEAASRFSLRFVKLTRFLILAVIGFSLILGCSFVFRKYFFVNPEDLCIYLLFPFLLNVGGGIYLTRKWRDRENLRGLFVFSSVITLFFFILRQKGMPVHLSPAALAVLTVSLMLFTGKECFSYIKESEICYGTCTG